MMAKIRVAVGNKTPQDFTDIEEALRFASSNLCVNQRRLDDCRQSLQQGKNCAYAYGFSEAWFEVLAD
jgi:hypothetical protein